MQHLTNANIPYSRLHDVNGNFGGGRFVDIPNIFRNFDADVDDPDCSGAVMEAMGYLNYHTVTPVIYEETMKLRYSENEDCSAMFDYMRDGRTFELATLHGMAFDGHGLGAYTMFRTNLMENCTNWVSTYKNSYEGNLTRVIGLLNNFYLK